VVVAHFPRSRFEGGVVARKASPISGSRVRSVARSTQPVSDRQTVWEVTKIERKTLDPSLFTVPAGYQQMQMPMGPPGGGQPPQGRRPVW